MAQDEDGDPRYQLTPKQIKAYAEFRRAKGQVEYNQGSILTTERLPIDELRRREIINDSQLWAAEAITRIHSAAFLHIGYSRMREMIAEITGCEARGDLAPMDIFVRVMRDLNRWQANIVSRVCWQEVRSIDYGWLYQCRGSVQASFAAVQDALERIFSIDNATGSGNVSGIEKDDSRPESPPS